MIDLNEILRKNIIIIMNQKKITVPYIISKTKTNNNNMYRYLTGERKISIKLCAFLAEVLDVPVKNLFDIDIYNQFKDIYSHPYKSYGLNKSEKDINERAKFIFFHRKLSPIKRTLQSLGNQFNISRERVRQIQNEVEKKHDQLKNV